MLKIAIIGIVASLLAIQLGEKKEYGTYISIICVVLVGYFVLDKLNVVITVINTLGKYIDIDISAHGVSSLTGASQAAIPAMLTVRIITRIPD